MLSGLDRLAAGPVAPIVGGAIDHLGVAVPDMAAAARFYRDMLGFLEGERRDLPDAGIQVAFMHPLEAGPAVELIAPLPGARPLVRLLGAHTVQAFLHRQPGGGLHHVCFRTGDLAAARDRMAAVGILPLGDGRGDVGASGRSVLFMSPGAPASLLIELKDAG